jgi:hypothetical protein
MTNASKTYCPVFVMDWDSPEEDGGAFCGWCDLDDGEEHGGEEKNTRIGKKK